MFRLRITPAAILLIVLSSCAQPASPIPTASPSVPIPSNVPHRPEIRFGLIGSVTNANVWALFDSRGYSYNNYAVKSAYWPRLYHLSNPNKQFEPETASGPPSAITQEGNFFTATVPLRTDLVWTDGSAFTAMDVAFTVNTVLAFQLGFDWHDAYNTDWLDHAEAIDAHTIKYYFKKQPNTGVWQFGVLQGPIMQMGYWSPRISMAAALLPTSDVNLQLDALKNKVTLLQMQVDALNNVTGTTTPSETRQAQANLTRQQGNLDQAVNDLSKAQAGFNTAMTAAREALYILYGGNEPLLGSWIFESSDKNSYQNKANPKFPFEKANFERAVYMLFPSESDAVTAQMNGDVDIILTPIGLSAQEIKAEGNTATQGRMTNPTRSLRFLEFNPLSEALADPALHQALACLLDPEEMVGQLNGKATALESFVMPQETSWFNPKAVLPCNDLNSPARLDSAAEILKSAGYTWTQEPTAQSAGEGLTLPNKTAFPAVTLLAPASDPLRVAAASYVQQQARRLGIPLTAASASSDQINYSVFTSHNFDMAIIAWKVSPFPGYLCDWFGVGNPFDYQIGNLISACATFDVTSDLDSSHKQLFEIQSTLADYLPFIPLFTELTVDKYHQIRYPFNEVLDGLSSVYGAPSLAIPASP